MKPTPDLTLNLPERSNGRFRDSIKIFKFQKDNPAQFRSKEISWNIYHDIMLKDVGSKKSEEIILTRKASVGPYIKSIAPFAGHSGITICLPKKSLKCVNQPSGISVNISRKCLSKSKSIINEMCPTEQNKIKVEKKTDEVNNDVEKTNFFDAVKNKVTNVSSKIRSLFHS